MELPEIPLDREIFETELATYWWSDDKYLVSLSKSVLRTVENLKSNSLEIQRITGNKPVPLLIYLTDSPMPAKDAREISTLLLPVNYSVMAMVSKPGLGGFIIKLLFSLKKTPIPIKTFNNDEAAKKWLLSQIQINNM